MRLLLSGFWQTQEQRSKNTQKYAQMHIIYIDQVVPRLTEFIDGAARLRGGAKAIDVWRMETKLEVLFEEARPSAPDPGFWSPFQNIS